MMVVRYVASSWVQVVFPVQLTGGNLSSLLSDCMGASQPTEADFDFAIEPGSGFRLHGNRPTGAIFIRRQNKQKVKEW